MKFTFMNKTITFLVLCVSIYACGPKEIKSSGKDILSENLDTTVQPGEDFFRYANGGWIKHTPIPASESGWGIGNMVLEENYNRLKKINEDAAAAKNEEGSVRQKIGDFWQAAMDSTALNKAGLSPLKNDLDIITSVKNTEELLSTGADLQTKGINIFFDTDITQDDKNSEMMVFKLSQGGLGMPNRDYYFKTDSRTATVREAYKTYLFKTFKQLGMDDALAKKNSDAVFVLEKKLATASRKLEDLRDPYKNYNKINQTALAQLTNNINWPTYLKNIGISTLDSINVAQPEFYTAFNKELKATNIEDWKNYLKFHLVANSARYLDDSTFNNSFNFSKSLSGAQEPRLRWKRVLDAEERAIGEALGQLFVKEYFNEAAKKRYVDLVENIRDAYKDRLKNLNWMSDSTKLKAYAKLAKISKKVGYPDKWKDFSALKIDKGSYVLNMQRAAQWWNQYRINKLGKPVDRTEWEMTPQTYNAYYNPGNNEIVLPAGIFSVPGSKDADLDDALIYGYAGASTIGHEITHGFDDQGRQYDEVGNLKNWWSKKDADQFKNRADGIIKQFNEMMPVDSLHINGSATQGENIADLGGMLLGLDAFKKTAAYKSEKKINGLTPLQRYFLGYAYGWLYEERKESLSSQVMTDVHSPAKERVNGPIVNIPEFYTAFGIKKGDKMYRPDSLRVNIW